MSHKIKTIGVVGARVLLGLIFLVFGLNFFFQFLPTPPQTGGAAESFTNGLFLSGYFFTFLKAIEIILGIALLTGAFVPLALVILMPITINIFLFHAFLTDNPLMSVVILALNVYVSWAYRDYYKPLLKPKAFAGV